MSIFRGQKLRNGGLEPSAGVPKTWETPMLPLHQLRADDNVYHKYTIYRKQATIKTRVDMN